MHRTGVTMAAIGTAVPSTVGRFDAHRRARRSRVARGVSASTVAVLAACGAHVAGGGAMPSPALLTAVLVLSWLPGVALIGVAVRLWRQAAVIAAAEAMLHGVLALQRGSGHGGAGAFIGAAAATTGHRVPPTGVAGMAGLGSDRSLGAAHQAAAHLVSAMPMPMSVSMPTSHGAAMPAWMWAAHAAAAAVTVLLWRRGEADIARVVAVAGRGLGRLLRTPGPVRSVDPDAALPPVAHRLGRAIEAVRTAHPHRGPPVAA